MFDPHKSDWMVYLPLRLPLPVHALRSDLLLKLRSKPCILVEGFSKAALCKGWGTSSLDCVDYLEINK